MPTKWSVDHSANSTTDEGTWIIDNNNGNVAIESGYYSGYFPYDGSWTNGLHPYYTINNGGSGQHSGTYLTAGSQYGIDAVSGGRADIGSTRFNLNYSVPNGFNFGMGEVVSSTSTWMGGGAGESFQAYWSPNGSSWYLWGFNNDCNNSPYWIHHSSGSNWSNGGY